jgi:hypothetical protein
MALEVGEVRDALNLVVDSGGYWYVRGDGVVVVGIPVGRSDLAEYVSSVLSRHGVGFVLQFIEPIRFLR